MRITGRILRPANLAERRLMLSLGLGTAFRVPRSENPFSLARQVRRLALAPNKDVTHLKQLAARARREPLAVPHELPDSKPADGEERAA